MAMVPTIAIQRARVQATIPSICNSLLISFNDPSNLMEEDGHTAPAEITHGQL